MRRPLSSVFSSQKRLPAALAFLFALLPDAMAERSVQVAWDPNPESNISGYRIYYGIVDQGSTNVLDVGKNTSASVTNLAFGTPYFFYVTAYNIFELESDPSTVLHHTTASRIPISVATEDALLAFAPVQLRIPATLEGDESSSLEIDWQLLHGPEQVAIENSHTIQPTVELTTVGDYLFRVSVSDDLTSDQANVSVKVIDPAAQPGTGTPPKLEPPMFLADGIALYWNSEPNAYYHLVTTTDLNLPYWVLLENNIPSQGAYTYWVSDSFDLQSAGFYTVFQTP